MISQKRGKNVAIAAAVFQLILAATMLAIWRWTGSLSAMACAWLLAGALPLWLVVAMLFYCRQLARAEAIELAESGRDQAAGGIFEDTGLRTAAARLARMERWAVPIFTILWAGYHLAIGVGTLRFLGGRTAIAAANPIQGALLLILVAFVGFLLSRYATGMSSVPEWRLLRAGGSYLLVNVLLTAAVAVSLFLSEYGHNLVDLVTAHVVAVVQVVLAAELVLNFILGLYRPRTPGDQPRPDFDSHLFALVAEPERVGHSIASAVNYQFGFEVSRTWFYRLLARTFVPLVIFGAAILVAMSSVVVVQDGEQHVLFHWGRMQPGALRAGLHFKWPWPIDTTRRFDVSEVREILVGVGQARKATERDDIVRGGAFEGRHLFLWTQKHGAREEDKFLVAVPMTWQGSQKGRDKKVVAAHMVQQVVSIQYTVADAVKFGFTCADAEMLLQCRAYQEIVHHLAGSTLAEALGLSGDGQRSTAEMLRHRIQETVGDALGVEIRTVAIPMAHPPTEVALDFEEVMAAKRRNAAMLYLAAAEVNRILGRSAGSSTMGWRLALAARTANELSTLRNDRGDPQRLARTVAGFGHEARKDVRMLVRAVEQETLLGQVREGEQTDKQLLLGMNRRHVKLLERIAADGAAFDFDTALAEAYETADRLLDASSGSVAAGIAQARAARWKTEMLQRGRADAFQRELQAYRANPRIYRLDRWLSMLDRVLPTLTKYVLCVDRDRISIWLNTERQQNVLGGVEFDTEQAGGK